MHPVRGQNCSVVIVIVNEISRYKFYLCLQDFEANEDLDSIVQHSGTIKPNTTVLVMVMHYIHYDVSCKRSI